MAKANFVKKARKDYPESCIKKGEGYYWWKFRYGGLHRSKYPPTRSQLTQSDFLSRVYDIEDRLQDLTEGDNFEDAIDEAVSGLEELIEECQEKFDNMPEQLQDSSESGQLLQERITCLEDMVSELEGIDTEVDEEMDEDETAEEYEHRIEDRMEEIRDEIQNITYQGG